jgi:hypothetical protein
MIFDTNQRALAAQSKRDSSTALRARKKRGKGKGARNSARNDGDWESAADGRALDGGFACEKPHPVKAG